MKWKKYIGNRQKFIDFFGDIKYADMYSEYMNKIFPIRIDGTNLDMWGDNTDGCYILNSNGVKFKSTFRADRNREYNFIENLNQFDFYDTFEMTKYDATDTITVVIDFQGMPVHIELKKMSY